MSTQIDGSQVQAGTLTGTLLAAATIQDSNLATAYIKADGTRAMTAGLNLGGFTVTNAGAPVNPGDLATKSYADSVATGLDVKPHVRAASTGANLTLSGTQTVDGVALIAGDRILVKDQTTASQNGIYVVAAGAWSRSADASVGYSGSGALSPNALGEGVFVFAAEGTANASSGWVMTTAGAIVIGTTAIAFVQFSGAGQITAGTGLTKTGNTLALTTPVAIANGGSGAGALTGAGALVMNAGGTAMTSVVGTGAGQAMRWSGTAWLSAALASTDLSDTGSLIRTTSALTGDLGGTLATPSVVKIQGNPVSSVVPTTSQVLQFNGTVWAPATLSGPTPPGGATGNVQYNNAGAFGGSAGLNWNNTANALLVGGFPTNLPTGVPGFEVVASGPSALSATAATLFSTNANNGPAHAGFRAGGTQATPAATPSGALLIDIIGFGHTGTAFDTGTAGGEMSFKASELWSATAHGTSWNVYLCSPGTVVQTQVLFASSISGSGRLGVNNASPAYTLDVSGDSNVTGLYRVGGVQIASSNLSDGTTLIKTTTTLGGDLSGNLPNPTIAASAITNAKVSATAAIAVTKIANGTAAQYLRTNAAGTANEWGAFVIREVPGTGSANGTNRYFQLAAVPLSASEMLFKNGLIQHSPAPTTAAGIQSLTFTNASATVATANTSDFLVGDVIRSSNGDALGIIASISANVSYTLAFPWDGATVTSVGTKLTTTGDYVIAGKDIAFATAPTNGAILLASYKK